MPWAKSLWATAGHARIWGVTLAIPIAYHGSSVLIDKDVGNDNNLRVVYLLGCSSLMEHGKHLTPV